MVFVVVYAIIFVKLTEIREGYGGYPGWALWMGAAMLLVSIICSLFLARKTNAMLDEQEAAEENTAGEEAAENIDTEEVEWTD